MEVEQFMRIVMARTNGDLSDATARDEIRRLDRRMWLEFNSSWLNYCILDLLLEEYPRAKFVLTIRDCYSWLDSIFNQLLGRTHSEFHLQFHRWFANALSPGTHENGDRALGDRGLWPLDDWLRFWNQQNACVMALVPSDRLLIIRTQDILDDLPRLAEFLGIPLDTLDAGRSHEHKAAAKFGLLSEIDENYLRERVEARCGDLMRKFFPEIRGLSDIPGYRPRDAAAVAKASA